MANYHLHVSVGNKAKGASASSKSEYITRTGEYEMDAQEVAYTRTGNLPSWAESFKAFWKSVDANERANGVVYREVEVSIPRELNPREQRELVETFAEDLTRAERLPYTMAIHKGGGDNPHAHIMICERGDDGLERGEKQWFKQANRSHPEKGGAPKVRELREKSWLLDTRASWAASANLALERAGREERIDHRSYKDRGIELTPQIHLGPQVCAMRARGIETERSRLFDAIEEIRQEQLRVFELERRKAFLEHVQKMRPEMEKQGNVISEDGRLEGRIERVYEHEKFTVVQVIEDPPREGEKPRRAVLIDPGVAMYMAQDQKLARVDLPEGSVTPEVGQRVSVRGNTVGYGREEAVRELNQNLSRGRGHEPEPGARPGRDVVGARRDAAARDQGPQRLEAGQGARGVPQQRPDPQASEQEARVAPDHASDGLGVRGDGSGHARDVVAQPGMEGPDSSAAREPNARGLHQEPSDSSPRGHALPSDVRERGGVDPASGDRHMHGRAPQEGGPQGQEREVSSRAHASQKVQEAPTKDQEVAWAKEVREERKKDWFAMMKLGLERRTLEPGERYEAVVDKVVTRGNQGYAVLVEYEFGKPKSYAIVDQPQHVKTSASLDKDDPKLTYARELVRNLPVGERVEAFGERIVSNRQAASRQIDSFKRELRQQERKRERELNPKHSRGRDGPDFGR